MSRDGKQARWERFARITAAAYRRQLGYAADCHRIDPRRFGTSPPSCQLQRLAA